MLNEDKKRIVWADYAKIVTIFLVVLEHSDCNIDIFRIFRMPLFFLVSGYFINPGKYTYKEFICRNLKFLIIPYFLFGLVNLPFSWISVYTHPELYPYTDTWIEYLYHPLLGICIGDNYVTHYSYLPARPLWFLVSLFSMRLLFYLLDLIARNCKQTKVFLFLILFICPFVFLFIKNKLNFASLDSTVLSFPFFLMGYFIKMEISTLSFKSNAINVLFIIGLLVYLCTIGLENGYVDINNCMYGNNIFLFYLNGFLGSYMVLLICSLFPHPHQVVQYVSANTIVILGMHVIMIKVCKFMFLYVFNIPVDMSSGSFSFVIGTMAFLLCYPFIILINKYLPWMIGRTK